MANKLSTLDNFRIVGELGRGAASRILHIQDPKNHQHFAMKVVIRQSAEDQKFLDQAKHEFEIAQRFDHPALVKFHDIRVKKKWMREQEVRTLLDYVHGATIDRLPHLALGALILVFHDVTLAIDHMHRKDVFHADIKPNNIMISYAGHVKVVDFGLAWIRGEEKGRVQGTMGFLAPEQVKNKKATVKTDIFNLGATMYCATTGRSFAGDQNAGNVIASSGIVKSPEEINPKIPPKLAALIRQCCELKPRKRPSHMGEVREKLDEIITDHKLSKDDLPRWIRRSLRKSGKSIR